MSTLVHQHPSTGGGLAVQPGDRRADPPGPQDVAIVSHRRFFSDLLRDALPPGTVRDTVDTVADPDAARRTSARLTVVDGAPGDERPIRLAIVAERREAGCEVLVVFSPGDPLSVGEWVEAGASAVLTEDSSCAEFSDVLERLRTGEVVLGISIREGLLTQLRRHRQQENDRWSAFASLTKREAHVLRELARGASPEEVARSSYVSLNTVRTQIRGVLAKLGVNSVVSAVVTAYQAGWIPRDDQA